MSHQSLSSRGLGHRPFTPTTRVRISSGTPAFFLSLSSRGLGHRPFTPTTRVRISSGTSKPILFENRLFFAQITPDSPPHRPILPTRSENRTSSHNLALRHHKPNRTSKPQIRNFYSENSTLCAISCHPQDPLNSCQNPSNRLKT